MTSKRIYLAFVLIAAFAVAVVFMVRQRELRELEAGNDSLRGQVESANSDAASAPVATASSSSSVSPLSAEEKNELLRLRGQVPSLRSEVANASNRVARLAESPVRMGVSPPSRSAETQQQFDSLSQFAHTEPNQEAYALSQAVYKYLEQHAGKLPDDLAAVQTSGSTRLSESVINRFELIRTGVIDSDPNLKSYLLIAHEKEPRQLPDGKWIRMYLTADGGLHTHGPLTTKPNPEDSEFIQRSEAVGRKNAELAKRQQSPPRPPQ